jgi:threonine aldolase
MIDRLAEDHANARRLSDGQARIPSIAVTAPVPTNIVMFELSAGLPGEELAREMDARGVRLSHRGGQRFRAVTHRMITAEDVSDALGRISAYIGGRR